MIDNDYILTAEDIHKSFGKGTARNHVLRGLSLNVRRGEFLTVMGPSGCGKSTLLHLLGLMTRPDKGRILIDGEVVGASETVRTTIRRKRIGFVFQRFNLLGVLSGIDNVKISLRIRGLKNNSDGRIKELLEAMGVAHAAARKPGQMSVGEQQRLAVVRALAHRPAILLADEPTGNLDSANGKALLDLLGQINRQDGQTIVMITHSARAADCADRILHMKDGRIDETTD